MRAATLAAVLCLGACGGGDPEPAGEEAEIRRRLGDKSALAVLREASASSFEPPADGRLTAAQVEMYTSVIARAGHIREVAAGELEENLAEGERGAALSGFRATLRGLGGLGHLVTAELRAAQELGHDPGEYEWVRERVLEAETAAAERDVWAGADVEDLALLRAQRRVAEDAEWQRELDRRIAELRAAAPPAEEVLGPALAHNLALVERYRDSIDAARQARRAELAGSSGER